MKEYEEAAGELYENSCYMAEAVESGVMNDIGDPIVDNKKWEEVDANPNCKICNGRGYQTYGNDCPCIWHEVKK